MLGKKITPPPTPCAHSITPTILSSTQTIVVDQPVCNKCQWVYYFVSSMQTAMQSLELGKTTLEWQRSENRSHCPVKICPPARISALFANSSAILPCKSRLKYEVFGRSPAVSWGQDAETVLMYVKRDKKSHAGMAAFELNVSASEAQQTMLQIHMYAHLLLSLHLRAIITMVTFQQHEDRFQKKKIKLNPNRIGVCSCTRKPARII